MSVDTAGVRSDLRKEMLEETQKKVEENLRRIKHKIIVMSGKGGVGKSTVATNLALSLTMKGEEVGLMDADIHGPNIPKMLNIENERPTGSEDGINPVIVPPHLKVMSIGFLLRDPSSAIIWRGPVKMGVIRQFLGDVNWGDLDYLVIDLPPGTGDEALSIAQLIPDADGAIIITTPQDVSVLDVSKAITFAKTLGMPIIGVIENMSGFKCPHCGEEIDLFGTGGGEKTAEKMGTPFLGHIPIDRRIVETGDTGKPFVVEYPDSEASKAFQHILEGVAHQLKKVL